MSGGPHYTEEEVRELTRRASGIVVFTRRAARAPQSPAAPAPGGEETGSGGDGASASPEDLAPPE